MALENFKKPVATQKKIKTNWITTRTLSRLWADTGFKFRGGYSVTERDKRSQTWRREAKKDVVNFKGYGFEEMRKVNNLNIAKTKLLTIFNIKTQWKRLNCR